MINLCIDCKPNHTINKRVNNHSSVKKLQNSKSTELHDKPYMRSLGKLMQKPSLPKPMYPHSRLENRSNTSIQAKSRSAFRLSRPSTAIHPRTKVRPQMQNYTNTLKKSRLKGVNDYGGGDGSYFDCENDYQRFKSYDGRPKSVHKPRAAHQTVNSDLSI